MEIYDLTDRIDWSENKLEKNNPEMDYKSQMNEVEGNGGNGVEINWDKYEVSYDCPMCVRKMMKVAFNSKSERMWADHLKPIFNNTNRNSNNTHCEEKPMSHIRTCAFYYFQSPVTKFDIDYLDIVEKSENISTIELVPAPNQQYISEFISHQCYKTNIVCSFEYIFNFQE